VKDELRNIKFSLLPGNNYLPESNSLPNSYNKLTEHSFNQNFFSIFVFRPFFDGRGPTASARNNVDGFRRKQKKERGKGRRKEKKRNGEIK